MIVTREIAHETDGLTMTGHLAQPDGAGPWPSVLLGHDGVGLEDYQRSRADELARQGYLAWAMEYHGGRVFFGEPDAMLARALPLLADSERMLAIGRAGLDILLAQPGADPTRLAALGYGAGGRILLELARSGVPFRGVALVHPALPDPRPADWAGTTASVLLCTGSDDPLCTPDQLLAFGRALGEAGVDWRAEIYGGAQHAFWARPHNADGSPSDGTSHAAATVPGVGYHPENAARAWRAVLDLVAETVGSTRVVRSSSGPAPA